MIQTYSKISIVTPCYNAARYIEETALSVLQQTAVLSKRIQLEYIICDGNSQDQTVSIVQGIQQHYPQVKLISEPDRGMYEALAKGLQQTSGEIVAYINAGDYYHKCAFDIVLDIFASQSIQWLTGYNVSYNENSQVTYIRLPYRYRRAFFDCGYYGTKLPYLQQESTFWRRELQQQIDWVSLAKMKYAGDFYLWLQFAQKAQLTIVEAYLGGFRNHQGQLSEDKSKYLAEVDQWVRKPNLYEQIIAACDRLLWSAPTQLKKRFNPQGILRFDHHLQKWV